jgi:maltose/maltodextrin transport system substrate-binding protein/arabinogalactan oligomer/maltooligosaccharide transport system substrate-binding protein
MKKRLMLLTVVALMLASFAPMAAAQDDSTLVIWADDTRAPILAQVGEAFTEEFGVQVDVQELGFGDIRDNLKVAGPAGEGPDIIIGAHDWLGELVLNGMVAPIDLGSAEELFLPAAVNAFNYDGVLYGMPYAMENVALVYNTELMDTPPATWEEVRAMSEEINAADGGYGYIIQTNDPYHMFPLMTAFGGYVFGVDDAGSYDPSDVGLDSAGSIEAAQWLQDMVDAGLVPADVDYDVMHTMFESGDAAMIVTGPWALPRLKEAGVPYAVAAIPNGSQDAQPFLGVQGFMISNFSENKELAEIFLLDYVATADVMQQIYDADPRPSAYLEVRDAIEDADIAGFSAAGENGLAMPAIPEMASVWTAWGNAQELIIRQQLDAESAMTDAAAQVRELIQTDLSAMVNVPGSWQAAVGCASDWDPACELTALTDNGDGTYSGTFDIPAGEYEYKAALAGDWGENYGVDGTRDGDNIALVLDADSTVTFTYDSETHVVTTTIGE